MSAPASTRQERLPAAPATRPRPRQSPGDTAAVAGFVFSVLGLIIGNVILGPIAVVLAVVAAAQRTRRRLLALTTAVLGAVDVAVLLVLAHHDGTLFWA